MKALTVSEKFNLIRYHGETLARTAMGVQQSRRSDVVEAAQRILDIAKTIPKFEWGIEE